MQRILIIILFLLGFCVVEAAESKSSSLYVTSSFISPHAFSIGAYYRGPNYLGAYVNAYSTFNSLSTESSESYKLRDSLGISSDEVKNEYTYFGLALGGTILVNSYLSFQAGMAIQYATTYTKYEYQIMLWSEKETYFVKGEKKVYLGLDVGANFSINRNIILNVGLNTAIHNKIWLGCGIAIF